MKRSTDVPSLIELEKLPYLVTYGGVRYRLGERC
jgi:hypothetical protein